MDNLQTHISQDNDTKDKHIMNIKKIWKKGSSKLNTKDWENLIMNTQGFLYISKYPSHLKIKPDINSIEIPNKVNISFYMGNKYDDNDFNAKDFSNALSKKIEEYLKKRNNLFMDTEKTEKDKKEIVRLHRLVYPDFANEKNPFSSNESYEEIKKEVLQTYANKFVLKMYLKGMI